MSKDSTPLSAYLTASLDQYARTLKGFATWLREKRHTLSNVLKDLQRPKVPTVAIGPLTELPDLRAFVAREGPCSKQQLPDHQRPWLDPRRRSCPVLLRQPALRQLWIQHWLHKLPGFHSFVSLV